MWEMLNLVWCIACYPQTVKLFGFLWQTSNIPIYEMMWAFMKDTETSASVRTDAMGIQRVRDSNGRYAFLVESTINDYINERKPCDTMRVGDLLNELAYGIGSSHGSELRLVYLTEKLITHLCGQPTLIYIYIYIYIWILKMDTS